MSHVQFCVSVSSQFVAVFDALHYENFLYHIIKELTWTYPDLDSFLIDKARSTSLYWTKLTVYWFILVSILISSCTMLIWGFSSLINSPLEKCILSLLLEEGGGQWPILYVPILLVPFRLGREGGKWECSNVTFWAILFFWRHPLMNIWNLKNMH